MADLKYIKSQTSLCFAFSEGALCGVLGHSGQIPLNLLKQESLFSWDDAQRVFNVFIRPRLFLGTLSHILSMQRSKVFALKAGFPYYDVLSPLITLYLPFTSRHTLSCVYHISSPFIFCLLPVSPSRSSKHLQDKLLRLDWVAVVAVIGRKRISKVKILDLLVEDVFLVQEQDHGARHQPRVLENCPKKSN